MKNLCIVVADTRGARFYGVEGGDAPSLNARLVERGTLAGHADLGRLGERATGPAHPFGALRERQRLELYRQFAGEVAERVCAIVAGWPRGTLVVAAGPGMLGFLREPLRAALHGGIKLQEVAKEYAHLTSPELHEQLALSGVVPAARRNGP